MDALSCLSLSVRPLAPAAARERHHTASRASWRKNQRSSPPNMALQVGVQCEGGRTAASVRIWNNRESGKPAPRFGQPSDLPQINGIPSGSSPGWAQRVMWPRCAPHVRHATTCLFVGASHLDILACAQTDYHLRLPICNQATLQGARRTLHAAVQHLQAEDVHVQTLRVPCTPALPALQLPDVEEAGEDDKVRLGSLWHLPLGAWAVG